MTNKQINAAIHAVLGNPAGCPRCSDPECAYNSGLNYCTDLNAMHEAEHNLTVRQFEDYLMELLDVIDEPILASARQRAEACLRTLGKWEEVQE